MCLNFSVTYVGVPYIAPPLALATRGFPHSIAAPWAAPYGHPCPTALTRLPAGFPSTHRFHSAGWHGAFESSGLLGGSS